MTVSVSGAPSVATKNGEPSSPGNRIPQAGENNIKFTFKGVSAQVSVNGGTLTPIDLTVELFGDTAKLAKAPGFDGSDLYVNVQGFFSSKALRLSSVAFTTPFSVHITTFESLQPYGTASFDATNVSAAGANPHREDH